MGITVTLYKNFKKRENSTKIPAVSDAHTDFTCTLKSNTSVLDPVLEFYFTGQDPADTPVGQGFNYAYIPKWSRYYYVTDWKYVNGIWYGYFHVDVLATYKTDIGTSAPYVLRAASNGNDDIVDTLYPATESWGSVESAFDSQPFNIDNASYVIGFFSSVAGESNNLQGAVAYYATDASGLRSLIRYLMSDAFITTYLEDPSVGLTTSAVKNFVDPLQYIESVRYYPFDVTLGAILPTHRPTLGWYDTTHDANMPGMKRLPGLHVALTGSESIPVNPYSTDAGKGFLNHPPYVEYDVLMEPWGIIPLNGSLVCGKSTLYQTIDVDLVSGMARMSIGTSSGRADLGIYEALVGVSLALAQITEDVVGAASSLVGGVIGTVGSALVGNIGGAISSAANGISNALDNIKPQAAIQGANNAMLAYQGSNKGAILRFRYCNCVGIDPAEYGRAYCSTPTSIAALSGYIKCAHGDIDFAGLDSEKRAVKSYLEGGFFYE